MPLNRVLSPALVEVVRVEFHVVDVVALNVARDFEDLVCSGAIGVQAGDSYRWTGHVLAGWWTNDGLCRDAGR